MKLPRRQFLHLAAIAAALPTVARSARPQTYPTRPVRIVVGAPPGGGTDIIARLMGRWLSERLSQQFVIENRNYLLSAKCGLLCRDPIFAVVLSPIYLTQKGIERCL